MIRMFRLRFEMAMLRVLMVKAQIRVRVTCPSRSALVTESVRPFLISVLPDTRLTQG